MSKCLLLLGVTVTAIFVQGCRLATPHKSGDGHHACCLSLSPSPSLPLALQQRVDTTLTLLCTVNIPQLTGGPHFLKPIYLKSRRLFLGLVKSTMYRMDFTAVCDNLTSYLFLQIKSVSYKFFPRYVIERTNTTIRKQFQRNKMWSKTSIQNNIKLTNNNNGNICLHFSFLIIS